VGAEVGRGGSRPRPVCARGGPGDLAVSAAGSGLPCERLGKLVVVVDKFDGLGGRRRCGRVPFVRRVERPTCLTATVAVHQRIASSRLPPLNERMALQQQRKRAPSRRVG